MKKQIIILFSYNLTKFINKKERSLQKSNDRSSQYKRLFKLSSHAKPCIVGRGMK